MTTDRGPKRCTVRAGGVTVSAQAKGAGMIEPGFATMLCFVQTDAAVADPEAALRAAVAGSFERITVDGQMSTNDTVLLQATRRVRRGRCPRGCSTPCCCSSRSRSSPTARAPPGWAGSRSSGAASSRGGRAGGARDRQLAARQDGPLRPRSQLGPDRPGRRAWRWPGEELEELGPDCDRGRASWAREAAGGRDRAAARAAATAARTSTSPT